MARKIGIVSPELPNNVQVLSPIAKRSNLYWFLEVEAIFAYLFHDTFDEVLFDAKLCEEMPTLVEKYRTFIGQMRPNLPLNTIEMKRCASGQDLGGGQFFPKLEVLFQQGELISVFQPIVEPKRAGIHIFGYECLSRIRHESVYFTPEFLFNYAQEKLTLSTYDKICLMQALSLVPSRKGKVIFINIRPQTLIIGNFIQWFKEQLKRNHLSPQQIVLEITEQNCIISDHDMAAQCRELKLQGFRIAIDDFGSGISNLSLLELMRPDFIKISGRFIKGSHSDVTKQKIIKNVIQLASDFDIVAVVENVEVAQEWHCCESLGATLAQGFYFHRPMPKAELLALI